MGKPPFKMTALPKKRTVAILNLKTTQKQENSAYLSRMFKMPTVTI